jgi:Transposase DDE domain
VARVLASARAVSRPVTPCSSVPFLSGPLIYLYGCHAHDPPTFEPSVRAGYALSIDEFRADIVKRGAKPVIPNKSNRIALHRFDKRAYKGRNVIERCFCRLKDFRRIATRYDKLARNFLAAVQLAAIVAYWIN